MANRAQISITGYVGKDPETKSTKSGTVVSFSVGVTGYKKDADGKGKTTWYRVSLWDKNAEAVGNVIRKGMEVTVDGRYEPNEYENKDGIKGISHDISFANVSYHGKKDSAENSGAAHAEQPKAASEPASKPASKAASKPAAPVQEMANTESDDLPF